MRVAAEGASTRTRAAPARRGTARRQARAAPLVAQGAVAGQGVEVGGRHVDPGEEVLRTVSWSPAAPSPSVGPSACLPPRMPLPSPLSVSLPRCLGPSLHHPAFPCFPDLSESAGRRRFTGRKSAGNSTRPRPSACWGPERAHKDQRKGDGARNRASRRGGGAGMPPPEEEPMGVPAPYPSPFEAGGA